MTTRSLLPLRAKAGQRNALVKFFIDRRVLEECRETVPGVVDAALLLSVDDPSLVCVTVQWADHDAFAQWLASPVRAAQFPDLLPYLEDAPVSWLFDVVHTLRTSRD